MRHIVLPESLFQSLLCALAFAPLLLLVCLPFIRDAGRRLFVASFIFVLPAVLVIGLWIVTNGQTKPPLGDVGVGLLNASVIWLFITSVVSLWLGKRCVRVHPWALLWLIPEASVCLLLGFFVFRLCT